MPTSIHFNPDPLLAAAVLDDLCNPDLSLSEIAEKLSISTDALSTWMTRPDIEERLATLANVAASRTRLVASMHLPSAVQVIASILKTYTTAESADGGRDTPEAHAHRESRRTRALRAASLLYRIANHVPGRPRRAPADPSPHSPYGRVGVLAGEGSVSYSPSNSHPPQAPTNGTPHPHNSRAPAPPHSPSGRVAALGGEGFPSYSLSNSHPPQAPANGTPHRQTGPAPAPARNPAPSPAPGGRGAEPRRGGEGSPSSAPSTSHPSQAHHTSATHPP